MKKFLNKNSNLENEIKDDLSVNNINNISNIKNEVKYKKVEIKKKVKKERNKIEIEEEDEKNKSKLPKDMTKRMNSFMDLSIVLNENSKIKDIGIKNNISRMWGDVSAIERKED